MRAAVLTDPGEFAIEQRERPDPDPGEVLVGIERVGICGSDVHYYDHGRIGDYAVDSPLVLGHESAGVVSEVGSESDLAVGDRVAIEPGIPCRRCEHCRRGRYNLCPDVTFMATPPDDGAFAEYVAWPADLVYPLPDSVSLVEGALCEPLSVGLHACRRGGVGTGDTVLITGAGPIGLIAMEAARAAGAGAVYVSEPIEAKRERGADATIDPAGDDLAGGIDDLTDGRDADVVIEASGAPPAIQGTVEAVRRGGTIVFVGLTAADEVPIDVVSIVDNEIDVRGTMRFANTYPMAISLLEEGRVDLEGLVDFEAPLAEVGAAFERSKGEEIVKGVVRID